VEKRDYSQVAEESIFLKEWLAGNRYRNQLSISAVCNSRCIFCSNHLNPFPIDKGIFRDIEDIKLQLSLMERHDEPIRMSDSLPGRIAEGEAFLHPEFFKILELVRKKFLTNLLCFTTNGSMLDEQFLKELSFFRPIEINVSLHSTRLEVLARLLQKSEKSARQAIASLEFMKKYNLDLMGTIVTMPKICGWDDIELTYSYFVQRGAKNMILYWPGYTICSPPEIVEQIECPMDEFMDFAERMRVKHKIPLSALPDMKSQLLLPVKKIMAATLRGNLRTNCGPYREVLWLASKAAHSRLKKTIDENAGSFPNIHYVFPVKNRTYEGNIIVAGLLMVSDFIEAGKQALDLWPNAELVLIPKTPFDNLYRDLQKTPAYKISDELRKGVWIVDESGNFDPLLSRQFFKLGDSDLSGLVETMKVFNLAYHDEASLEKSLDLFDSFPVETTWGDLSREQYREMMVKEKLRLPDACNPLIQEFKILDSSRALCLEKWPTKDPSITFNKWIFLIKRGPHWKIESVAYGKEDELVPG